MCSGNFYLKRNPLSDVHEGIFADCISIHVHVCNLITNFTWLYNVVFFMNRWVNFWHAVNNLSSNKALINTVKTEMYKDSSEHWTPFWMMELNCRCYTTWVSFYQKQNSKHLTEQLQEWSLEKWTVCKQCSFQFLTCVQLIYSPLPAIVNLWWSIGPPLWLFTGCCWACPCWSLYITRFFVSSSGGTCTPCLHE